MTTLASRAAGCCTSATWGAATKKHEREARLRACTAGWKSMGRFWFADIPWKQKMSVFLAKVAAPSTARARSTSGP